MDSFKGKTGLLSGHGFDAVKSALKTDDCALWSLITVETQGFGFQADRRPKILFERHIFSARTGGRFDASAPAISSPTPGGYFGGAKEYDRLAQAIALDRKAALESASWGLGQIMGFHAVSLGYGDAETMVAAFCDSEDAQLDGVARFIRANTALAAAFASQDWATVALHYNGKNYAKNEYDHKLAFRFDQYKRLGVPNLDVRGAQARLTVLGCNPGTIDGMMGANTRTAIGKFQRDRGIASTSQLDSKTLEALQIAVGF